VWADLIASALTRRNRRLAPGPAMLCCRKWRQRRRIMREDSMAQGSNRQITLASHPEGEPAPANFAAAESPIPEPAAGQLLLRNKYLSLDPYMRGRMHGEILC
jgi:hypothetical protein